MVNLIQIQEEEIHGQSGVLIKHQNLAIRNRSHKQETNIGKREAKEACDFKGGSLLAVGNRQTREKERKRGREKNNNNNNRKEEEDNKEAVLL